MAEWILSSSILILIVIAVRTAFKGRISLRLQYAIWGLVLVRLLIPFSFGNTNFSVANLTNQTNLSDAVIQTAAPNVTDRTEQQPQTPQAQPNGNLPQQNVQNAPVETETGFEFDVELIYIIWAFGSVLVGAAFALTNIRFRNRIVGSRSAVGVYKKKLKVYATGEIDTPCLFGLMKPTIYVTNEVAHDRTLLRHTVVHEATHYCHGDHIWAVLRCVCLALHWYNPLVWWAAFLSQRDAELACDEATIMHLGEGERAEYGRTLIVMTCQKKANVLITATTMTASKRGIKERILLIAKKPKTALYTLVTVVLIASVAVGCTFTGAKEPDQEVKETLPYPTETDDTERIYGEDERKHPLVESDEETTPTEAPVALYTQNLEDDKVCIAVLPTCESRDGGDYYYIIPEDQATLLELYNAANTSAHGYTKWDSSNRRAGWWIVYQGQWWQVTEGGAMFGTDQKTWDGICIDADDAGELYEFCDAAVKEAGIAEPVRPEDITEIKSATLYWNGTHTVTDEYALKRIEKWIANSREEGSVSCWFTAQLVLELDNGESKVIAMATDSCATWMSEGVAYGYGEITEEGIKGSEEFYSLFAPAVIHDKSKEGMDAVNEYLFYLNWSRYANQYGVDETFALIDMIEKWAAEEPTYNRFGGAIGWTTGLDGAYADYYAAMLVRLYELAPSEFAWACLGNATDAQEELTLSMLAYHWNITPDEARTKLQAEIPQN